MSSVPTPRVPLEHGGTMIVRRFTEELEGKTPLEAATKAAQEQSDIRIEEIAKNRTDRLYQDPNGGQEPFQEAELVRNALKNSCEEFFAPLKKERRIGLFHRSRPLPNKALEHQMGQRGLDNVESVKAIVETLEEDWKAGHGKVYRNFQSICQTLDAHRSVFAIFPRTNEYVSVLSGALSMIVEASVNHAEIAERLSGAVAHLCERASICSRLLYAISTDTMRLRLTEVYKKLFLFLCTAADWFKKSPLSRFWDSFNSKIVDEHEKAAEGINKTIDLMIQEGQVKGIGWTGEIRDINHSIYDKLGTIEAKVDQMRGENYSREDLSRIGEKIIPLLLMQFQTHSWETRVSRPHDPEQLQLQIRSVSPRPSNQNEVEPISVHGISRAEADLRCNNLESFIYGTDGLALAQNGRILLADATVMDRLGRWVQAAATQTQKLWIEFPFEFQEDTSARMAALGVILTAAQAHAPFISYICEKPHPANIPRSQSAEEAGLLSIVYSLVRQLLRFRPENDLASLKKDQLDQLDGGKGSWKPALDLLGHLLEHTPVLCYCIIQGLNDLETGEGEEYCREFLRLLLSQACRQSSPLSLLFTTSGQSRVLHEEIPWEDRARTENSIHTVERRGQQFNLQVK